MSLKVYSSGHHIQNINGVNIKDQMYELAVNPNDNNKVHVSVTNDRFTIKKEYDNLEKFLKEMENNNDPGLITTLQKDLKKFKSMPKVLHNQNNSLKNNNKKNKNRNNSKKKQDLRTSFT